MPDPLMIIEDERLLRQELTEHFREPAQGGWEVLAVETLAAARRRLAEGGLRPLVVLSDLALPDGNALDLLEEARARELPGEWILLTGYGSVPDSVRALRLGAYDFLEKPCDLERLDVVVAGAARSARAQRRLHDEAVAASRRFPVEAFLGRSPQVQRVRDFLQRLAAVPFTAVLLTGETGTGKGLVARILHHNGPAAAGPLVEVNCAALPRELLESELFGHEAGAYTGARGRHRGRVEQAQGGTLFLDEVGELPPELQAKLLQVVEDRRFRRLGGEREIEVEIRLVAATNRDLEQAVAEGSFRSDLYHRLGVFRLELPPLRHRREDLRDLIPAFVAELNAKADKEVREVPEEAWERLESYSWPGNVRELRNVVERCVLLSRGPVLPLEWLQLSPAAPPIAGDSRAPSGPGLTLPLDGSVSLDEMERRILARALELHKGNVAATARALGTTRETLRYRIQKYDL